MQKKRDIFDRPCRDGVAFFSFPGTSYRATFIASLRDGHQKKSALAEKKPNSLTPTAERQTANRLSANRNTA